MNFFTRQAAAFSNDVKRSCGALLGIVQGMLADGALNDQEISFLQQWLANNENIAARWPGNVLAARLQAALADGVVTSDERRHLVDTLQALIGDTLEDLASNTHVSSLALDDLNSIEFETKMFCFTGDFAYGPRDACIQQTVQRKGTVVSGVTKKLSYLVVGGLGSPEWKHGSFGLKIEKAVQYRGAGVPLRIVHEDTWAASAFQQGG